MQQVDPFIPVHKKPPLAGQYGAQYLRKPVPKPEQPVHTASAPPQRRPRAIDGFVRPSQPQPRPQVQVQVPRRVAPKPKRAVKARTHARPLPQVAKLAGIIIGAVCIGLFLQSLVFGELLIGIYAVYALVRHVPSRTTFVLALIALVGIVLLLTVQGSNSVLGNNFAVYAFLLLVVGTVSLGLEVRRDAA